MSNNLFDDGGEHVQKKKLNDIISAFPFLRNHPNLIYLDSAATTLKPQIVIDAIINYYSFQTVHGGRSQFDLAYKVNQKVLAIRKQVAKFIQCNNYTDIVFTAGATAGLNNCAYYISQLKFTEPWEIIVGRNEHSSNLFPWVRLAESNPLITLKYVNLSSNQTITLAEIRKLVTKQTRLVSINAISNVFGKINEFKKIGQFLREKECLFCIDASQAVAHTQMSVRDAACDFLVFGGHKMYGPTGIGVMYVNSNGLRQKRFMPFTALIVGGGAIHNAIFHEPQQIVKFNLKQTFFGYESGTLNYAGIIGLGVAIEFIEKIGYETIKTHDRLLIEHFCNWAGQEHIAKHVMLYSPLPDIPIFIFNVDNIFCQDVASFLNEKNICIRAGEHCVLLNELLVEENKSVRVSCGIYNQIKDLDYLFTVIENLISISERNAANVINNEFVQRQIIMDHYAHPIHKKKVENTDYLQYYLKSDECIDEITFFLKYDYERQIIADIKFTGSACSICVTACDILCELLWNKSLPIAKHIIDEYRAMIQNRPFEYAIVGDLICLQNTYKVPMRIKCATLAVGSLGVLFLRVIDSVAFK